MQGYSEAGNNNVIYTAHKTEDGWTLFPRLMAGRKEKIEIKIPDEDLER